MPSHTKKERAKRVGRKIRKLRKEGKPQQQAINTVSRRMRRKR